MRPVAASACEPAVVGLGSPGPDGPRSAPPAVARPVHRQTASGRPRRHRRPLDSSDSTTVIVGYKAARTPVEFGFAHRENWCVLGKVRTDPKLALVRVLLVLTGREVSRWPTILAELARTRPARAPPYPHTKNSKVAYNLWRAGASPARREYRAAAMALARVLRRSPNRRSPRWPRQASGTDAPAHTIPSAYRRMEVTTSGWK